MATVRERIGKAATTFQVRWLQGGRGGSWESEKFADQAAAEQFKKLVDAHGQHWPPGWVKGEGFVEQPKVPGDMPFVKYATRYVDRLTGIDDRTREDYHREIRLHLALLQHTEPSGHVVPATICNVVNDDIADWVRLEENGSPTPRTPHGGSGGRQTPSPLRTGTA